MAPLGSGRQASKVHREERRKGIHSCELPSSTSLSVQILNAAEKEHNVLGILSSNKNGCQGACHKVCPCRMQAITGGGTIVSKLF